MAAEMSFSGRWVVTNATQAAAGQHHDDLFGMAFFGEVFGVAAEKPLPAWASLMTPLCGGAVSPSKQAV